MSRLKRKKTNPKQQFYQKVYQNQGKVLKGKSLLYSLYLVFKRFEQYREDVVFELLPKGKRFLDIGCGEGNLVFKAVDKFDYSFGLDIARTRLKIAEKKKASLDSKKRQKVRLVIGDADGKLPFSDNYFDAIAMVASLEHLFDPFAVVKECRRVLKRKAVLIIQVPNLTFLPRRLAVLFGKLPVTSEDETGWDGGHLHYFTVASLRKLLEGFDFKTETVTCSGVLARQRSFWLSALGADIIISASKR